MGILYVLPVFAFTIRDADKGGIRRLGSSTKVIDDNAYIKLWEVS